MRRRLVFFCVAAGVASFGLTDVPAQVVSQTSSAGGGVTTIQGETDPGKRITGTGAISGVVTDGATGQPLAGAFVALAGARGGAPLPRQMTDARGRFVFTRLPPHEDYVLSASRHGYMDGGYKRTPGIPSVARVALRDGEWFAKGDIPLWKPASISGVVADEAGDPLVGIPVRALVQVRIAGTVRWAAGPTEVTDDRGMYRLANLTPGQYVIHVPSIQITLPDVVTAPAPSTQSVAGGVTGTSPGSQSEPPALVPVGDGLNLLVGHFATPRIGSGTTAYPMMYHPAARSMDQATPISVGRGDQRANVDVQIPLVPTARISGRVVGPAEAVAKLPVRLVPAGAESLGTGAEAAFTQTNALGEFTFLRVPEGLYTIMASRTMSEYTTSGNSSGSQRLMPNGVNSITSMSQGQVPGSANVMYSTRSGAGAAVSGRTPVAVGDRDVTDIVIPLVTGVDVSGHYLWDGSETAPAEIRLAPFLRLEPADGDLSLGLRSGSSSRPQTPDAALPVPMPFTISGVLPGKYTFGSVATTNYTGEAVDWNGRDVMRTPFEVEGGRAITGVVVRLTSKRTTITGYVRDATGATVDSGAVLTFPTDPALWRDYGLSAVFFKTSTIVTAGSYRVTQLLPGEYYLAAVSDEDRAKWLDPEFLKSISGSASRITVASGATLTKDLRMIAGGGR